MSFIIREAEGAIMWDDPDINIYWRIPAQDIAFSAKDARHKYLKDFVSPFDFEK